MGIYKTPFFLRHVQKAIDDDPSDSIRIRNDRLLRFNCILKTITIFPVSDILNDINTQHPLTITAKYTYRQPIELNFQDIYADGKTHRKTSP